MEVNFLAVLAATGAMFIAGAIWYMPIFGGLWGRIHGFEKQSKKEQEKAQKDMLPLLGIQAVMTGMVAYGMAWMMASLPNESAYALAFWTWLTFMFPPLVGAVIFGGTSSKWIIPKIAVMTGGWLVNAILAAFVIGLF